MHGARPAVLCPKRLVGTPGQIIKQRRGGVGKGGNNSGSPKHYTKILAENAMALGWLDGKRIGKGALAVGNKTNKV